MHKTLFAALVAIATALALALAGPADAAKLKPAKFKVEAEGEQLTTWVYDKTVGPCDFPDNEDGRQYLSFDSPGNTAPTIRAVPRKDGGVVIHFTDDEEGLVMYSRAEALRNYEVLYSQMTPCSGGDPYGGEPSPDAIGTATCNLEGQVEGNLSGEFTDVASLYYTSALERMDEPKASIYFGADGHWGNSFGGTFPSACYDSGQPNADLGLQDTEGEWPGNIIPVAGSLSAKKLLTAKRKFSVDLGRTVNYPNDIQTYVGGPVTTGKTRVDVTLTFTRVGR
jgi:hypothetical protein